MQLQEQIETIDRRIDVRRIPRGVQFALFLVAMGWAAAAGTIANRAAEGIATRFHLAITQSLLSNLFILFLIVVGLRLLDGIATRGRLLGEVFPLPFRPTWRREWLVGAAVGWGICVVALLPLSMSGNLHARFGWGIGTTLAVAMALLNLLLATLAQELIFRGYAFRRLTQAVGPAVGTILMSLLFAVVIVRVNPPRNATLAMADCTLLGLILAMAWLRTHGLWLGWGLNFAYRAVAAVWLGLPIAGQSDISSPTDISATGPRWLTGGAFGLDAALPTALVLVGALAVLYLVTRDWAWRYTHPVIVAGGYEVEVAPPAAHVAMEQSVAPPPLVQILSSTPQSRSVVEPPPQA
jgi:membrane protease YdiL (CAAX protease family)